MTGVARCPATVNQHVAAVRPAQLLQLLQQRRDAALAFRIVRGQVHENADAPHPLALLRASREWPCHGGAAEPSDELTAPHSITSSARASSVGGISRPSTLAVVRLMMRSNLVGCSTGMSAGFAPRRILST